MVANPLRVGTTPSSSLQILLSPGPDRTVIRCRRGRAIFAQGDPADSVFHVQKGKVKLTVQSSNGREAVLGLVSAGHFLGEACIAGHSLRIETATAMEDCSLIQIPKAVMVKELQKEPSFANFFITYLLSRNVRYEEDLLDHLFNSAEKRLARLLLLLAGFDKQGSAEIVIPKISHETLAEMVGTTRARVTFFMNRFRRLGLVDYKNELKVRGSLLSAVLQDSQPF